MNAKKGIPMLKVIAIIFCLVAIACDKDSKKSVSGSTNNAKLEDKLEINKSSDYDVTLRPFKVTYADSGIMPEGFVEEARVPAENPQQTRPSTERTIPIGEDRQR